MHLRLGGQKGRVFKSVETAVAASFSTRHQHNAYCDGELVGVEVERNQLGLSALLSLCGMEFGSLAPFIGSDVAQAILIAEISGTRRRSSSCQHRTREVLFNLLTRIGTSISLRFLIL